MAGTKYIIGDKIRFKATIKDFAGKERSIALENISVTVKQLDGTVLLSSTGSTGEILHLSTGTTGQYYYDWKVSTGLTSDTRLAVIWEWSGEHKKKLLFNVIPIM